MSFFGRAAIAAAAALLMAIAFGPAATAEARCEPARAGSRAGSRDASPSLDTVLTRLQQHYDCTRSFRASFTEELSSPGGMKRKRQGVVYFKKAGRMRWEFGAPSQGTVVSDGKQVYDYEEDLNQVVEMPVNKALKTNATAFLLGLGNVRQDFDARRPPAPPDDGLVHVMLTPKGGGDTMELGLDPRNYNIVKFKLTNQIGGITELVFSDIQTDIALNDSLFTFEVPPGVDIVSPAQQ